MIAGHEDALTRPQRSSERRSGGLDRQLSLIHI